MKGLIVRHHKWKKIENTKILVESTNEDQLLDIDFKNLKNTSCDFIVQVGMPNEQKKYIDYVYEGIKEKNKPILIKELPVLRSVTNINVSSNKLPFEEQWHRFSWNHYWADIGIHPYDPTYNRWEELVQKYNIQVHNWQRRGDAVLINCQLYGDSALARLWENKKLYEELIFETVDKIKSVTDRPIILRPHPKDSKMKFLLSKQYHSDPCITISSLPNLYDDFNRSWCTVTYNSTSCVESVLYGLPAFTLDCSALTHTIIPNSLTDIEKDIFPNRIDWCKKIAFMQWSGKEIQSGYPWTLLRKLII